MRKEIYPCTIVKDDDGWIAYADSPENIASGNHDVCSHGRTAQDAYNLLFHLLHKMHQEDAFRVVND